MKFVVYDGSNNPLSAHDTEAEAIGERDKALGRVVYQRQDDHEDVKNLAAKPQ